MLRGCAAVEGHLAQAAGMDQPYENQQGQLRTPVPRRKNWGLTSWAVALGKKARGPQWTTCLVWANSFLGKMASSSREVIVPLYVLPIRPHVEHWSQLVATISPYPCQGQGKPQRREFSFFSKKAEPGSSRWCSAGGQKTMDINRVEDISWIWHAGSTEKIFTIKTIKGWDRFPERLQFLTVEIFKTQLDKDSSNLIWPHT